MELVSGAHIKYQMVYHLVWTTKYRYHIFRKETNRNDYAQILRSVAQRHGISIIDLAVMENHVHAVVSCHPSMSVSKALFYLKGASSYEYSKLHPNNLLRYPSSNMLSAGSFCRTVGDVDLETTRDYVQAQDGQRTLRDF